jgi:hypothetical protein
MGKDNSSFIVYVKLKTVQELSLYIKNFLKCHYIKLSVTCVCMYLHTQHLVAVSNIES